MPADILVKFQNHPALEIELADHPICRRYLEMVAQNCATAPIFRDPCLYNVDYLQNLAVRAKKHLGWDWLGCDYSDVSVTTLLHKNIEKLIGNGYNELDESLDDLLHEIHFCLHSIQGGSQRGQWLQVEWFNDDGFALEDFDFQMELKFGDVKLQNPYVGHTPLLVYEQNDHTNLLQTCKFHDLVRPGINIVLENHRPGNFSLQRYLKWFDKHGSEFLKYHGKDKLLQFTGWPVVGRVKNLTVLEEVKRSDILQFESIKCSL